MRKLICDKELMVKGFNVHGSFGNTQIQTVMTNNDVVYNEIYSSSGVTWDPLNPYQIKVSEDGVYKLFDFDASGLVDLNSQQWILEPQHYWSYNEALKNGCITPKEIDDWGFNYNIIQDGFKLVE